MHCNKDSHYPEDSNLSRVLDSIVRSGVRLNKTMHIEIN